MAKAKKATETQEKPIVVPKFSKKKIVNSRKFAKYRDLVNVLLDDDKEYSSAEVEEIIKNFLAGKRK